MAIRLNPNKSIVENIKKGLKRKADTAPAEYPKQRTINVCAKNSGSR